MEKVKINAYQLFVLTVLFEHGSALVISLGTEAKHDAWLTVLLGMVFGLVLYLIYCRLYLYYPDIPLTSYVQKIMGNILGKVIALFYIIYFLYLAARVLRDFGELLLTFSYPNTPLFVINAIMILTIIYAIHKGIEVLARTGELFFFFLYFLAISGFILIVASGLIDLKLLKPFLEDGITKVFRVVLTQSIYFPFGEMIAFTMILPYLNIPKRARMVGLSAMILSGINLTIVTAVNMAVLGADIVSRSAFPLLSTIQKIEVANFLERLDVFFMLAVIIGGFFKISVFFYAGIIGLTDLFKIKDHKKLVYPIGIVILFLSLSIASNFAEHLKEGLVIVPTYLHLPMQVILPTLLCGIAIIRNRKKQKNRVTGTG